MNFVGTVVMIGWIPVVILLFMSQPYRRAVLYAYLAAWLFLPPRMVYFLPGLPDYTKMSATTMGVLLATAIFDMDRLVRFRPRWFDLPMALWCIAPMFSSITNGLGAYDGASESFALVISWGAPYLVGRLYFNSFEGVREVAMAILIGGLIYVPLCLFEAKMSPQLHNWVYGYHQHNWLDTMRMGGWRPTVFMQHGLAVGLWMVMATTLGIWLATSRCLRSIAGVPPWLYMTLLVVTTLFCRSMIALGLMLLVLGILAMLRYPYTQWRPIVLIAIVIAPFYMFVRTTDIVPKEDILAPIRMLAGPERTYSIKTRLNSEGPMTQHAMAKPMFGHGGHGRFMPKIKGGLVNDMWVIPDAMWTIKFAKHGLYGLFTMTAALLLPIFLLWRNLPPSLWTDPRYAYAAALAAVLLLFTYDCLLNAMENPVVLLASGALCGFAGQTLPAAKRKRTRRYRRVTRPANLPEAAPDA